jgi:cyanophycinase-like exopeptidase
MRGEHKPQICQKTVGVPIGGTSAGLNVLTQFVYSAQASKGVSSSQALDNPFNRNMSFDHDFVTMPILSGIIGDPHFYERDRMGRDLAFMCRIYDSGWSLSPRTISVDEQTALQIDENGNGIVVASGSVYLSEDGLEPYALVKATGRAKESVGFGCEALRVPLPKQQ